MIIHRDYCSTCKTKEQPLLKYSKHKNQNGDTVQYYICRGCNREKHTKWYRKNPRKAMAYNRRYQIRKEMNQ